MEFASGSLWSACSVPGSARSRNSDAYAVRECDGRLVVAVADGVGVMEGSPLASKAAVNAAVNWACDADLAAPNAATDLFNEASAAIKQALKKERISTGATTLVCAIVEADSVTVVGIGDSEILAMNGEGPANRLLPLDQQEDQPNVLTAWLDGQSVFTPHLKVLAQAPERLLLVTDGVSKGLDYSRIARIVRESEDVFSARSLVQASVDGGVGDDVTAVVVFP